MPAPVIRANYETLEKVSGEFQKLHQMNEQMMRMIQQYSQQLLGQGWKGDAARSFEAEMQQKVLPRLHRLCEALQMAATVTKVVSQTMQDAENQASGLFR